MGNRTGGRFSYHRLFRCVIVAYVMASAMLLVIWNMYVSAHVSNHITSPDGDLAQEQVHNHNRARRQKDKNSMIANYHVPKIPASLYANVHCSIVHKVTFMSRNMVLAADPICGWLQERYNESNGNYVSYGYKFTHLRKVVIHPELAVGRKGGENMSTVWNQKEEDEYFKLKKGYFTLKCKSEPVSRYSTKNHLSSWHDALICGDIDKVKYNTVKTFTIAVQRYEYVNLYHTMTDYYNAFLMMLFFNQTPENTNILWIDSHPIGGLDETWATLFGKTMRAGHLPGPTFFSNLVWGVMGYDSPLNQHDRPYVPYLEEFREFFLSRHGISSSKLLDCNKLNVLFIWRRDYVAHPRNPKGVVKRKIANEDELLQKIRDVIPGHEVKGIQLDILPMKQQLKLIANTDILLGMHGAGMSHALFLPRHGGVIEFYPIYWPQANRHFRAMSNWRGLPYQTWQNHHSNNEMANYNTYIPPKTAVEMFLEIKSKICSNKR